MKAHDEMSSTEEFVAHRELLFSIVYNVLGSVADTEDVLQETWLAWSGRFPADPRVREEVTQRFVDAIVGGDLNVLLEVLAPDVTLWADGGGKARAAGLRPLRGRDKIARLIVGDAARRPVVSLTVRYRLINGDPSAVLLSGDTPFAIFFLAMACASLVLTLTA